MPGVSTAKMTAKQYLILGDDPHGRRSELVNGKILMSRGPRQPHSSVGLHLTFHLLRHIRQSNLGELLSNVNMILGEYDVRRPDLMYFSRDRAHVIKADKAIDDPPDLCVEIVRPTSGAMDRMERLEQYAIGRVAFYWIVDPQMKTIEAYKLDGGRYKLYGRGEENESVSLAPFLELQLPLEDIWFQPARK